MNPMIDTDKIIESLDYVKRFSGKTVLIKLGGSILQDENLIKALCRDLSLLKATGMKIIIVHGGGKAINAALSQYQVESTFLEGLRVTSDTAMSVIEMVLSGQINTLLVRKLNALGVKAVGLSGADNNMLLCDYHSDRHGYVGKIQHINASLIQQLLASKEGYIPIISSIGVDAQGNALNINADCVASDLAVHLHVEKLIYLTDQVGINDDNGNLISSLSYQALTQLIKQGTVKDGMLTKANTILNAMKAGLDHIHILSGKVPHALLTELFTEKGIGTVCQNRLPLTPSKIQTQEA